MELDREGLEKARIDPKALEAAGDACRKAGIPFEVYDQIAETAIRAYHAHRESAGVSREEAVRLFSQAAVVAPGWRLVRMEEHAAVLGLLTAAPPPAAPQAQAEGAGREGE